MREASGALQLPLLHQVISLGLHGVQHLFERRIVEAAELQLLAELSSRV